MGVARYRKQALSGRSNFQRLFQSGQFTPGPAVSVLTLPVESEGPARWAVCVSRKAGKATVRNRIRRVTREALDDLVELAPPGRYIAVFPRREFAECPSNERSRRLRKVLRRAGLLAESQAGP